MPTSITRRLGAYGAIAGLGLLAPQCAPQFAPGTRTRVRPHLGTAAGRRPDQPRGGPSTASARWRCNATLTAAAQAHSADQASVDTMCHTGTDGSNPGTRIVRAGYRVLGLGRERRQRLPRRRVVMVGWMNSPGHRANILNGNFTEIGIGLAYAPDGTTVLDDGPRPPGLTRPRPVIRPAPTPPR